jgi:hypothetical protein
MSAALDVAAMNFVRHATPEQITDFESRLILAANAEQSAAISPAKRVRLVPQALPVDLLSIEFPPRCYSWGKYGPLGTTSALIAEGKVGKSTLSQQKQLCIAAGRDFLGFGVTQGVAIYISAEDPIDDVHRRAQKILQGFTADEVARAMGNYFVFDAVGAGLQFIRIESGVARIAEDIGTLIEACLQIANGRPIVDIVIDTVSRVNGGEENSNAVMAQVEAAGARLAQETGAAVCFLHHTGKAGAREGITDHLAGRGASSFGDNCRSVLRLMPATADMVRTLEGIDPIALERGDILKLVHAALNVDRRTDPVWLQRTADGLIERINPSTRNAADTAEAILAAFLQWWHEGKREPFTRSTVTRGARRIIWPKSHITEQQAGAFLEEQLAALLIQPAGTRKGSPAFTVNDTTAEAILKKGTRLERETEAAWNEAQKEEVLDV